MGIPCSDFLPGPLDADEKHAFAWWHLELVIRGLRAMTRPGWRPRVSRPFG
ncbi:hypothetical protein [Nonomuraea sp. NEAU-A123]|uniref:hypothetical protein n=1 Tax=Nonomuraea sp. NEAU-A123 TaxID=2839649 RepID=UPI001BE40753|nr:hypothetical protein [Nonomuraea sp. NEAU-A123]MBT2235382.1 hypothetical protein [Nonomuraea sp. NEAU-A123]